MKTANLVVLCLVAYGLIGCFDVKRDSGHTEPKPPHGASNQNYGAGRFVAGQFVVTIIDNASFFRELPMGEVMPDLFLMKGFSLRVISPGETYSKVELDDGRIGYVMTAMLAPQMGGATGAVSGGSSPTVPPLPPGGIPEVIDPAMPGGR